MTIDDSLEHPWIKVGVLFSIYLCRCHVTIGIHNHINIELSIHIKKSNVFLIKKYP